MALINKLKHENKKIEYTTLINSKYKTKTPEFNLMFETFGFNKYFKKKKETEIEEFNEILNKYINTKEIKELKKRKGGENLINIEFNKYLILLTNGKFNDSDSSDY